MIPLSAYTPDEQRRMGLAAAQTWIEFARDVKDPTLHERIVQNAIKCLMIGSYGR